MEYRTDYLYTIWQLYLRDQSNNAEKIPLAQVYYENQHSNPPPQHRIAFQSNSNSQAARKAPAWSKLWHCLYMFPRPFRRPYQVHSPQSEACPLTGCGQRRRGWEPTGTVCFYPQSLRRAYTAWNKATAVAQNHCPLSLIICEASGGVRETGRLHFRQVPPRLGILARGWASIIAPSLALTNEMACEGECSLSACLIKLRRGHRAAEQKHILYLMNINRHAIKLLLSDLNRMSADSRQDNLHTQTSNCWIYTYAEQDALLCFPASNEDFKVPVCVGRLQAVCGGGSARSRCLDVTKSCAILPWCTQCGHNQ